MSLHWFAALIHVFHLKINSWMLINNIFIMLFFCSPSSADAEWVSCTLCRYRWLQQEHNSEKSSLITCSQRPQLILISSPVLTEQNNQYSRIIYVQLTGLLRSKNGKKWWRYSFHSQDAASVSALAHDGNIGSNFFIVALGNDKSDLS